MKFLGGFITGILTTLVLGLAVVATCLLIGEFARESARDEIQRYGEAVSASFEHARHEKPAGIVHLKAK